MGKTATTIVVNNPRTSYYVGGAEVVSMEHAKGFMKKGLHVIFMTIKPSSINQEYSQKYLSFKQKYQSAIVFHEIELTDKIRNNAIYSVVPGENRNRWNFESLVYNQALCHELEGRFSNINIDFMLSYFGLDALIVPQSIVKKNILYLCGIPKNESIFRHAFLFMYDLIFAITDETRDYWQKYTNKMVKVIPTGVDIMKYQFSARNEENDKGLNIAYVGRLIDRKGCDLLIDAIHKMSKKELKNVKNVWIIGDGPQIENIKKLIKRYNLGDIVKIVGEVSNVEEYYPKIDVLVAPSREGEGLQGVILEAMASGCYVVATRTETTEDLLGKNSGALIAKATASNVKKALLKIMNNPAARQKSTINAVNIIKEQYTWNNIIEKMIEEMNK